MSFLQYVDVPGYAGLILRRKSVDLDRSEAILARAKEWWLPTRRTGVVFHASSRKFTFPSGATCEFGHTNNLGDEVENYQGGSWHFVGFDELTHFYPQQYLYLFTRVRRGDGVPVPVRIRATANPGGLSHNFVRDRFMSKTYARQFLDDAADPYFEQALPTFKPDKTPGLPWMRYFVPSKAVDNPSLDSENYFRSLGQTDVLTAQRMRDGNWLVSESGVYDPEWFRRFEHPDYSSTPGLTYKVLTSDGKVDRVIYPDQCYRFITLDSAGSSADRKNEKQGKSVCASVISVWDYSPCGVLLWRRVVRLKKEFPEVLAAVREVWREERAVGIWVETDGIGASYYQALSRDPARMPIYPLSSGGKDKFTRAAPSTHEAKEGRVMLPKYAPWLDDLEAELFSWQGTSDEQCDQIDTLAYAVLLRIAGSLGGIIQLQ